MFREDEDKSAQTSAAKAKRRRFARIETSHIAVVECGERYFTVGLANLSSNGARIEVNPAIDLDHLSHIIIPDIGGRLKCEKIWQDGRTVGLRFLDKPYEVAQKMPAAMRHLMIPLAME